MTPTLARLLERVEELDREATRGPWAWCHIGEKTNGYSLGTGCTVDGSRVSGLIEDRDDIVDVLLECAPLGEHEASTVNYSDPEFMTLARTLLPAMAKALKVAMGIASAHVESSDGQNCNECARPHPCPAAAKLLEIESLLAEGMK